MTARCPSELALEAHLLEPERSPIAAHVAGCARCAERLARMRAEGDEFRRVVFPVTVEAVEAAARRAPWWRRAGLLLPVPALAAVAAVLLLFRPSTPPEEYVGLKGSELTLTVFAPGPAGARAVADGGEVPTGAPIRFRVHNHSACDLWLLSVDGAGSISRLLPASGDRGAPLAPGATDLPGGAVLDLHPGPERIYAICSPQPLTWSQVEGAVRAANRDPARLRLPAGTAWASVLLEKRR